jgi:hypothetical protein
MTVTLEIPEELARLLGPEASRMSREALALEAHRQELWTEAELGRFLGLSRLAIGQFLKDRGVEFVYNWDDLESERKVRSSPGRNAGRYGHQPVCRPRVRSSFALTPPDPSRAPPTEQCLGYPFRVNRAGQCAFSLRSSTEPNQISPACR